MLEGNIHFGGQVDAAAIDCDADINAGFDLLTLVFSDGEANSKGVLGCHQIGV